MDVFLIPTSTSGHYELYYEAPDADVEEPGEGTGMFHRMRLRFAEMLREADAWRHRRHDHAATPVGIIGKLRRKVMGFVVERIAEQRLLWHMRKSASMSARIPTDMTESEADRVIRETLKHDADHHLKWLLIDLGLLVVSLPLVVIPGPNLPGLYFTFQVVGHYLSMRGAQHGLSGARWTFQSCEELSALRDAMTLMPPHRQRRFRELADRLRLEHLATFCESVAAPSA